MAKLDNVATGVENLTRSFSGEKIDNLLGPFTDFLKDNQTNLTATIANIKTVRDRIRGRTRNGGQIDQRGHVVCLGADIDQQPAKHGRGH